MINGKPGPSGVALLKRIQHMPGQIPMRSAKAAGVAGQAEHSQGGPAQHSASFSRKLDTDLFRERQPSRGKEGRDSRALEATPLETIGDCPPLSTTNSLAQRSSSVETSTPRQFGILGQHKNHVDLINLGRVDALGPPSQDYPMVFFFPSTHPPVPFAMRLCRSC